MIGVFGIVIAHRRIDVKKMSSKSQTSKEKL